MSNEKINDAFIPIGEMEVGEVIEILKEIEDENAILEIKNNLKEYSLKYENFESLTSASEKFSDWTIFDKIYKYSNYEIGHIPPLDGRNEKILIKNAKEIIPNLHDEVVDIKLETVYIEDFPGRSPYTILFQFKTKKNEESIDFIKLLEVSKGSYASTINKPIFNSLKLGERGLPLETNAINVKNKEDQTFLNFLKNEALNAGLSILSLVNPIIGIVSAFCVGISKGILNKTRKNHIVLQPDLFFDLNPRSNSVKLKEGSYIIIQLPNIIIRNWNWNDWIYHNGHIKNVVNGEILKYNYIVIGIYKTNS